MNEDEMRRLFFSTLDQVINEIDERFSHQNTKLHATVSALQPENINYMDVKIEAMPTVHLALKLRVTLGAFTVKCENSFSILETIVRDRRQSIKHARKVHLAFESDLERKLKTD